MKDDVLERIFTVNLGVGGDEKVLVFTDLVAPGEDLEKEERKNREKLREIARSVAEAGRRHCSTEYVEYKAGGSHGKEPPEPLWIAAFGTKAVGMLASESVLEKILTKTASADDLAKAERIIEDNAVSPDAVVALSNYSTSHTRFRDYLTRCKGTRYASMPRFEESMITGVMTADWKEVEQRTLNLVTKMTGAQDVILSSHNGTSIIFSIKGRDVKPDTGIITEPGSFSNLPAGEAFLAPVEGTAEGLLVLEWAPHRKLKKPIELVVKEGLVTEVIGDDPYAEELKGKLGETSLNGNIAELGIGTNDKATRPDNILETEKILGTVHIALGDNSSFGGHVSVPFHQDFIFFKPTLEVLKGEERVEILIDGEPFF